MRIYLFSNSPKAQDFIDINERPRPALMQHAKMACSYNSMLFDDQGIDARKKHYLHFYKIMHDAYMAKINTANVICDLCLYMRHPYEKNYSHFTLNCLGAFLYAKTNGLLPKKIKLIIDNSRPFQRQLISLFGLDKYEILNLNNDSMYEFKNVIYFTNIFNDYYHPDFVTAYEIAGKRLRFHKPIKLYITRISNRSRSNLNEEKVIDYFKHRGFEIADFDKLPVVAQIALVNSADIICAAHGASGANLAYRNKDHFRFIELFSENLVHFFHANLFLGKDCDYSGTVNPAAMPVNAMTQSADYTTDVDLIDQAMGSVCHSFRPMECVRTLSPVMSIYDAVTPETSQEKITAAKLPELERAGKYAEALEYGRKIRFDHMDRRSLELYYMITFLTGKEEQFEQVDLYFCNIMQRLCYPLIFNLGSVTKIQLQLK